MSAAGLAKFSDVWPWPPGRWTPWAVAAVLGGFGAMGAAVAGFTRRLWSVNAPIIWRSDPDLVVGLRKRERPLVDRVYDEMATLNEVPSLRAYEARSLRWERIAPRMPAETSDRLRANAAAIRREISGTHARANLRVVQARATAAFTDWRAAVLYALFGLGVVAFGLGADYLESERSGRLELAKTCAETAAAGATELPAICPSGSPSPPDPSKEPTARQEVAKAVVSLASALESCENAVKAGRGERSDCAPLRRALSPAAAEP